LHKTVKLLTTYDEEVGNFFSEGCKMEKNMEFYFLVSIVALAAAVIIYLTMVVLKIGKIYSVIASILGSIAVALYNLLGEED